MTVFSTRSSAISNTHSKKKKKRVNLYLKDFVNEFGEEMVVFLKK